MIPEWKLVRRALTPMAAVRLYYLWKYGALIEPTAEVDLSPAAAWAQGCVISSFTKVKIVGPFVMGRRVRIGSGCFIDSGAAGLRIGDEVVVGPGCTIVAVNYRFERLGVPLPVQGTVSKGIRIGHRVRIGPGSVVLDGADIGDAAIVLPGSVVSGQVPSNSIVHGIPLRVLHPPGQD